MPLSDLSFRAYDPASPADLAAIRALHGRAFAALAASHHDAAQIAAHLALIEAEAYEADLAQSHVMLAVNGAGEILGSAGWLGLSDRPDTARIRKVFIDPALARQGLASALVRLAEAEAARAGRPRLVVRANINAVPLYLKLGYEPVEPGQMEAPGGVMLPVLFMRKG
jgi:GNAT superfamily N-acetyltransferase